MGRAREDAKSGGVGRVGGKHGEQPVVPREDLAALPDDGWRVCDVVAACEVEWKDRARPCVGRAPPVVIPCERRKRML